MEDEAKGRECFDVIPHFQQWGISTTAMTCHQSALLRDLESLALLKVIFFKDGFQ